MASNGQLSTVSIARSRWMKHRSFVVKDVLYRNNQRDSPTDHAETNKVYTHHELEPLRTAVDAIPSIKF